jgi:hypothetical protein
MQIEALDLFDALANDPSNYLDIEFKPGDVQLIHNHVILHDRTDYEDWPEPERKRHLLRLWLCPPNGRPLPAVFADRYGTGAASCCRASRWRRQWRHAEDEYPLTEKYLL